MSIAKASGRQVNPGVAAALIILALGAVQYFWWKGLVSKPPVVGGGRMGGSSSRPGPLVIHGVPTAMVETVAGDQEAGTQDGPRRDSRFDGPTGLAVDKAGDILVADTRNDRIRILNAKGYTTTIAGSKPGFRDGPIAEAQFRAPSGVAAGNDGAIYVADTRNNRIRKIAGGRVTTVSGSEPGCIDGPAQTARFNLPASLCIAKGAGGVEELLIADAGNRRIRALSLGSAPPMVRTVKILSGTPSGLAVASAILLTTLPDASALDSGANVMKAIPVEPGPGSDTQEIGKFKLRNPTAVATDSDGTYVVDSGMSALFRMKGGVAMQIAGISTERGPEYHWRDGAGNQASFGAVGGVVSDGKRHIYVADTSNNTIRRVTVPAPGHEQLSAEPDRWRPD